MSEPERTEEGKPEGCAPSKCATCPMRGSCSTAGAAAPDPDQLKINEKMAHIKHKLLVLSGKGGVGKSTVSAQLASTLALRGHNVGILDIDICGPSIPRMLGCEGEDVHGTSAGWSPVYVKENLGVMSIGFMLPSKDDAVIWRGPRKNGLIKQFLSDVVWGDIDYLIIDTPPGTSDEHISIVTMLKDGDKKPDGAIVVTTPQEVSLMAVRKEINFCKKTDIPVIGVVENMSSFVCPDCGAQHPLFAPSTGGAKKMCEDTNTELLGQIPMDPRVCVCCDEGKNVMESMEGTSVAKALSVIVEKLEGLKTTETETKDEPKTQ
ncbi:Cytosolic Fe-S cluster assembly factor nubp1 [Monocercomonoides exilis]|uniref:Cytosolic Fe-S cluster assembly factor nubp1 n=1 Tax=Monocercomonoides exilis TaxID=2049356 RepID=UPI00355A0183|nr:Cytosolic Fe-S cluster assembly factor nubp1 [Monocercomonoides exilis]|eukprot:MONOS_8398.1-p1 / transcript=MONOS_8398.1 / gene=MONOS_8398 / organism=Monocercomonoides_exilis_PA203 / gene_product=Cytosolic Fe-S cluster assembly factor nubp1 / transcript_product=Cytosolic Fe-S cluster assembly factor nubp1 / location=Mono_scaffold00315:40786-41971(+) / protein_length=320 / sequence_SO=supercontig / SO=protein_coding / is_pseudo=false